MDIERSIEQPREQSHDNKIAARLFLGTIATINVIAGTMFATAPVLDDRCTVGSDVEICNIREQYIANNEPLTREETDLMHLAQFTDTAFGIAGAGLVICGVAFGCAAVRPNKAEDEQGDE